MKLWEFFQRIIAAVFLLPAFGFVCIAGIFICQSSSGPLLIRQKREGFRGIGFQMFKLRTMFIDADDRLRRHLANFPQARQEWNNYGRLTKDPRISGIIACFARRSSIDELPQLLNVILGNMNLVGPRPLPPEIVSRMNISDRLCRQRVLPGITGLWQVSGRSELKISEMGVLDRTYVENRSVRLDLLILARTLSAVLSGRGAY